MNKLARDIELAHRRRWPARPLGPISSGMLLASSPGLRLMLTHRMAHWLYRKRETGGRLAALWRLLSVALAPVKWIIHVGTKSHIASECEIEGGVCFSDQGHIMFGAVKTGAGTVIGTRATIGRGLADAGHPEIGRNVWIGADCIVYGAVRIGDGATLLPGTVLSKSIPAGVVVQGNPARLVVRNFDNSALRRSQHVDAEAFVGSVQVA